MNCPICNHPMSIRNRKAYIVAHFRKWEYFYDEMVCEYRKHKQQSWQTPEQLQANIDAINEAKSLALQFKRPKPLPTNSHTK